MILRDNPEVRESLTEKFHEFDLKWIDLNRKLNDEVEKKAPQYKKWMRRPGYDDVLEIEPGDEGSYRNVLITIPMVHTFDSEQGPPYSASYINPHHWDGVANIIVNVLMDTKGNAIRILEIQSVYHQMGNKKGYGVPESKHVLHIATFPHEYQEELSHNKME